MKILIIDEYLNNSELITTKLFLLDLITDLQKRGHIISVVTSDAYRLFNVNNAFTPEVAVYERDKAFVFKGAQVLLYLKKTIELIKEFRLLKRVFNVEYGGVIFFNSSIYTLLCVSFLRKNFSIKSILLLNTSNDFKLSGLKKSFYSINNDIYSKLDWIGARSESLIQNIKFYSSDCSSRVNIFTNWTISKFEEHMFLDYKKALGLESKSVFLVVGDLIQNDNLLDIVELAFKLKKQSKIHFLYAFSTTKIQQLKTIVNVFDPPNITILKVEDAWTLKSIIQNSDFGVFSELKEHNNDFVQDGLKYFFEFNKKVIGFTNSDSKIKKYLAENDFGFSVDFDDKNGLSKIADMVIRIVEKDYNFQKLPTSIHHEPSKEQNCFTQIAKIFN